MFNQNYILKVNSLLAEINLLIHVLLCPKLFFFLLPVAKETKQ